MPAPHLSNRKEQWWIFGGAVALVVIGVALATAFRPAKHTASSTNTNSSTRDQYATLYQAAWRQDSGQGNVTVTATLLDPQLMLLLGQDSARSSAEEQLWQADQKLTDHQIGFFLTLDTVGSPIDDTTIGASGSVTATGLKFTPMAWQPFIAPSHIVNTSVPTTEQTGVLIFSADQKISWPSIKNIQLTIKGIDDQPDRRFTWADPQILQP